jgi:hypothetical protein
LNLLGIDWGRLQPLPPGKLGTFHELWSLKWRPEMVLQIVEAAVYGNTLIEAAAARAIERGERITDLGRTAELVQATLLADLETAVARLVALLGIRSAESADVSQMLRALPPLVSTLRYGDVRRTDAAALENVLSALAERATVGMVPATVGLDDEAADSVAAEIVGATQALALLVSERHADVVDDWWAALRQVIDRDDSARLINGTCTRLALNAERLGIDDAESRLARALARGTPPADAARWIEGFLSPKLGGSGLILASSTSMFGIIDDWLTALPAEYFSQILPLLRRTTSTFSQGERRQIAERVRSGRRSTLFADQVELDLERAALVEPIVHRILGIGP